MARTYTQTERNRRTVTKKKKDNERRQRKEHEDDTGSYARTYLKKPIGHESFHLSRNFYKRVDFFSPSGESLLVVFQLIAPC